MLIKEGINIVKYLQEILMVSIVVVCVTGCNEDDLMSKKENSEALLLEDCEDGDNITLLGGSWFVATDVAKGANSTVSIFKDLNGAIKLTGEGCNSKSSFKMSYHLSKGSFSFDPFVICGFSLTSNNNEPFDASHYEGLSYYFKGPSHLIRVETSTVTDFCYHAYNIPASAEWKLISVPFTKLSQNSWGEKVPFDITSINGISWQITGKDSDSSTILIDDIYMETVITEEIALTNELAIQCNGIQMKAFFFHPDSQGSFPLVIVLPGGTTPSNIGMVYPHHKYFGERFSSRGMAVLALDYSSDRRTFFDTLQIDDILKALEYCKKKWPLVDSNRIFLTGFSIGGANALRVAGSVNDISGVICYFSPCDWNVSGGGYGIKKQPLEYCKDITCPVLILQGDSDKVTSLAQSRLLHENLQSMGKTSELIIYEGAAHGFTYKGTPPGNCIYNEAIAEDSYLKVESFIKTIAKSSLN